MSLAALPTASIGMRNGNGRILLGVVVSLAVHALFVLAYRGAGFSAPVFEPEPAPITVTLRAPPPPEPEPEPPRVEPKPPTPAPSPARRPPPKRVIAVPATPSTPAPPDPFTVQQPEMPEQPSDEAPRFDMDAARRIARANAHMRDPSKQGTAHAQFPEPPLQTESKAARAISKAKRANCKDGIPGGLLAPLYLAMDKKDSGCKW